MTNAAQRDCQKGKWYGFERPDGWLLIAVAADLRWADFDDGSPADQQGIAWAIGEYPEATEKLTGQPTEEERHYQTELVVQLDSWQFRDIDGSNVVLSDDMMWVPGELPDAPPEAEAPPPPETPPPGQPLWFTQEPRSWHLVPLPDNFVFNLAWCYWVNKLSDGTCRARLIYPCDDTEPLPDGISFSGDRIMVFAGEMAARLWAHIQEVIARQFD